MIQDNLKNKKYVIFGAGDYGKKALEMLGRENVAFFVDNDKNKDGSIINGVEVKFFQKVSKNLKEYWVIIAVAYKYIEDIKEHEYYEQFVSFREQSRKRKEEQENANE